MNVRWFDSSIDMLADRNDLRSDRGQCLPFIHAIQDYVTSLKVQVALDKQ